MRLYILLAAMAYASSVSGAITFTITKAANPTADQADAYKSIDAALTAAAARYKRLAPSITKAITAVYDPTFVSAKSNLQGLITFGRKMYDDGGQISERTALHEISHTLGVGLKPSFADHCKTSNWPSANKLLQTWDGADAKIKCDNQHFWPYGLNFETEWSDQNGDRNVQLVVAMIADGL